MILIRGIYQFYILRYYIFPSGVSRNDVNVMLFANADSLPINQKHDTALNLERNIPFPISVEMCDLRLQCYVF